MTLYFGIPILLIAAVLQSVWLEGVQVLGGRPDLVLTDFNLARAAGGDREDVRAIGRGAPVH